MRRWGSRETRRQRRFFAEGVAGGGLQILLKCDRLLFVTERHVGFHPPRSVLRRVWDFSGVVLFQSGAQIVGDADVEVLSIKAFQNIDVFHEGPLLSVTPCMLSQDIAF